MMENGGDKFRCLVRRKRVDAATQTLATHQLARKLSLFDLVAIGVGATIGAGVYILVGTVAREHTGPSLTVSFFIGGLAAALSAFCYAELACRCPSAGSAYHYSYVCIGEGVAWLIGWALILEYTLGGAAVARGVAPNLASFFGGVDKLPSILARQTIFGIVVDPGAAILVVIITALLCTGIKESSLAQAIITTVNISALVFIILAGAYLGCKTGWPGYEVSSGYFSFGVNGLLAGSATVFFSYIGFDIVASTAEEVKNPQRDMPLGIGIAVSICVILYMLVSAVIVGLVPYYALDPDTPISSAFAGYGMEWAVYIITAGAVTALCASLIGAIIPQPRILMAMARDGLLPSFFSDISRHTQVPVKGTIATGIFIAILAFFMDVSQLAGMVSVGTLLSFTIVALSILILRYVPPDELPFLPSDQQLNVSGRHRDAFETYVAGRPLLQNVAQDKLRRRKVAAWSITMVCFGVLVVVAAISTEGLSSILCFILSGIGGMLVICCLTVLNSIDQAGTKESFTKPGGFMCPFVPFLPVASVLINTYLLLNIGAQTWIRVLIWLGVGVIIYIFYGRGHSLLFDDVRRPITHTDDDHADATLS
ncbi:cationic amino acid transporter 4, vacuolar-like isoform X1 [Solanum pennellii]|uniref:Cationic amino acid transporter 4, vacuolar-like isoform X1 n=1 Tax=Solanum pennellii TaxID=28526 RepID=A0ABM1G282_SOLPN|nr:cationic amino acid transporter 4, vacuolar-like isoform X1 [Solanum pennellii]